MDRIPWTEPLVGYSALGHRESDVAEVTWHGVTECAGVKS